MKFLAILLGLIVCAGGAFVAVNFSDYRRAMDDAQKRLAGSEILETDRGKMEYKVQGSGFPVLLIHGAGGGYDQGLWLGKISLSDSYKLISVSRFGYLRSEIPSDATIKMQADQYKTLLDHLGIEKAILLAGSAGGPSATRFANDYPERTSALMLVSAVSGPAVSTDKAPFYINIIHLIQRSDFAYWIVAKYLQPTLLSLMGVPASALEKFSPEQKGLAQEMLDIMHPMSQRYPGTALDSLMIENYEIQTVSLKAPTLIMHAKDDALVSFEHAKTANEKIAGSEIRLYDTGGHGMLSQMDDVKQSVKDFLKNNNLNR